ncbi:hypothetical protein ACLOJK_036904 [Asimina triloba]
MENELSSPNLLCYCHALSQSKVATPLTILLPCYDRICLSSSPWILNGFAATVDIDDLLTTLLAVDGCLPPLLSEVVAMADRAPDLGKRTAGFLDLRSAHARFDGCPVDTAKFEMELPPELRRRCHCLDGLDAAGEDRMLPKMDRMAAMAAALDNGDEAPYADSHLGKEIMRSRELRIQMTTVGRVLWINLDQATRHVVGYIHNNIRWLGVGKQRFLPGEPSVEEIEFEMQAARVQSYTKPPPLELCWRTLFTWRMVCAFTYSSGLLEEPLILSLHGLTQQRRPFALEAGTISDSSEEEEGDMTDSPMVATDLDSSSDEGAHPHADMEVIPRGDPPSELEEAP